MAFNKKISTLVGVVVSIVTCGCSSQVFDYLDPYQPPGPEINQGELSLNPVLESGGGNSGKGDAERARQALEVMGSYQRAQAPQPYNPVMNPAQVRLMWVPDHLNKAGDLVPAHFYYLRVLPQTWAVQDAFEIERQLNVTGAPSGAGGATPWVYSDVKR